MTLLLSGTNGVSDVDGTAATPAIRGSDTNTGIFFPAADTIAFAEGGVESARLDSAGNLGIGTSSPAARLHIASATTDDGLRIQNTSTANSTAKTTRVAFYGTDTGSSVKEAANIYTLPENANYINTALTFQTRRDDVVAERMRLDSSGNLLVGTTSVLGKQTNAYDGATAFGLALANTAGGTAGQIAIRFMRNGSDVGSVTTTNTATAYNTSSDYRLKEDVQPMAGALAKVVALKPCTYKWKADGSDGEGFIAHELAEVVPQCVTGEKDAVDADGNPQYQGIDTSFLVATLTAAIQELHAQHIELKAIVDQQATEIANLKGQA